MAPFFYRICDKIPTMKQRLINIVIYCFPALSYNQKLCTVVNIRDVGSCSAEFSDMYAHIYDQDIARVATSKPYSSSFNSSLA